MKGGMYPIFLSTFEMQNLNGALVHGSMRGIVDVLAGPFDHGHDLGHIKAFKIDGTGPA